MQIMCFTDEMARELEKERRGRSKENVERSAGVDIWEHSSDSDRTLFHTSDENHDEKS